MVGKVAVILFFSSLSIAAQANEIFRWMVEFGQGRRRGEIPGCCRAEGETAGQRCELRGPME